MVTQPKRSSDVQKQEWALLSYRIPRQPSTPRIAVWRRLKELGVVQIGDGLVALPGDARCQEQLEWVSVSVEEAGGEALVWLAQLARRSDDADLIQRMRDARSDEYRSLLDEIESDQEDAGSRTIARWRREWRKIDRRDYFRAPGRDGAKQAIANVAESPDRIEAGK